jgi:hypothetical protein
LPELKTVDAADMLGAVASARQKITGSVTFVRSVYASLCAEQAPANAPSPDLLDPSWALFRWVQCQLLAAVRIFTRYDGSVPRDAGTGFWTRAEHSMLDVYYVVLGSLAG